MTTLLILVGFLGIYLFYVAYNWNFFSKLVESNGSTSEQDNSFNEQSELLSQKLDETGLLIDKLIAKCNNSEEKNIELEAIIQEIILDIRKTHQTMVFVQPSDDSQQKLGEWLESLEEDLQHKLNIVKTKFEPKIEKFHL